VYAFCNTHDITWGTKGDDKAEKLPSVTTKADGKADIHAPTDDADLNTQYESELRTFSTRYEAPKKIPSAQDKQEDYYKGFRSAVVLAWMFCNLALCAVVLQTGGLEVTAAKGDEAEDKRRKATIYLGVVLWSVAGLSAFRFIGAMWFLIVRLVSPFVQIPPTKNPCALWVFSISSTDNAFSIIVPWCLNKLALLVMRRKQEVREAINLSGYLRAWRNHNSIVFV
jgi:hypothetical protein